MVMVTRNIWLSLRNEVNIDTNRCHIKFMVIDNTVLNIFSGKFPGGSNVSTILNWPNVSYPYGIGNVSNKIK